MTTDRVFIEDLRVETVIGIFDWEREIKRRNRLQSEYTRPGGA